MRIAPNQRCAIVLELNPLPAGGDATERAFDELPQIEDLGSEGEVSELQRVDVEQRLHD
jgi:hypothetical protein